MSKLFLLLLATTLSFGQTRNSNLKEKELTLSSLFSDGMVLQQQENVAFWGESKPNDMVTATPSWQNDRSNNKVATNSKVRSFSVKADSEGKWTLKISSPKAGGPYSIEISTGKEGANPQVITIKDVMIGEVWLASGQSNMDMPLSGWMPNDFINKSAETILKATNSNIRFFKVPYDLAASPKNSVVSNWVKASPETAKDFSATAYFFALKLSRELNVPIGIIQSAVGGTPAEAWTSKNRLSALGDFNLVIDKISNIESKTTSWFKDSKTQPVPKTTEGWKNISFNDSLLANTNFNDDKWEDITLPDRFDLIIDSEFNGAMWLRKTFQIEKLEDAPNDYTLIIGGVDDMDATYINGKYIGGLVGSGHAQSERSFKVPKSILKSGKNTIAIRAIDTGGPGEISGPMLLKSEIESQTIPLKGTWKKRLVADIYNGNFVSYDSNTEMADRPDLGLLNSNAPTVLYNAMIAPLVPFTIKGAIWYQGETNVGRADQYEKLFPAIINDWRNQWKSDFPFYYVQIAPFTYGGRENNKSQNLRNAQRLSLKTPKTGMVVTLDIGKEFNIHPPEKEAIGNRLAGLALANDYKKDIVASGPLFKSVKTNRNQLIVAFTNIGSGLSTTENGLSNFEIAGADKNYQPAKAKIEGKSIVLTNSNIKNPIYVRYAWGDISTATLFNKEGLPASTFTSEKK